jgi:lysophospholipase L1-like esterase
MKKPIPRLLALFLAWTVLIGAPHPAEAAYVPKYEAEAGILYDLGLFRGTDQGFELDRTPKRTEALVLLVRLLGKDSEAQACREAHPFTDVPAWADRYVAWCYKEGLTKGVSDTSFGGGDDAGALVFVTFILRALGYDDGAGDFSYQSALEKAADIGLIPAGTYNATSAFFRDDCVRLCYAALTAALNGTGQTLAAKLASGGAISGAAARKFGLLPSHFTVACIGDSFTSGFGLDNPESEAYPAVLASLTGEFSFTAENYSTEMVTVNEESYLSFAMTKAYARSVKTEADIILFVMGANDAIWTPEQTDLAEDLEKLLQAYLKLPQKPRVIVMTPPRLVGTSKFDDEMAEVVRTETAVANKLNLKVIDLFTFSEGMAAYSSDKVHLNAEGHRLVAEYIYKALSVILSE